MTLHKRWTEAAIQRSVDTMVEILTRRGITVPAGCTHEDIVRAYCVHMLPTLCAENPGKLYRPWEGEWR